MGSDESPLVSPRLAAVVVALTVLGWLFTELYPDSGMLTTAVDAGWTLLLVGFGVYVLLAAYTDAISEIASGGGTARSGSSAEQSAGLESKPLSEAGPSDIARILKAARPLPGFVMLALLPFIFPYEGRLPVPGLGVVPVPWYWFPIGSLVACVAFYWWYLWMSPLPLVRGK
jgi:hypothetical protein